MRCTGQRLWSRNDRRRMPYTYRLRRYGASRRCMPSKRRCWHAAAGGHLDMPWPVGQLYVFSEHVVPLLRREVIGSTGNARQTVWFCRFALVQASTTRNASVVASILLVETSQAIHARSRVGLYAIYLPDKTRVLVTCIRKLAGFTGEHHSSLLWLLATMPGSARCLPGLQRWHDPTCCPLE